MTGGVDDVIAAASSSFGGVGAAVINVEAICIFLFV